MIDGASAEELEALGDLGSIRAKIMVCLEAFVGKERLHSTQCNERDTFLSDAESGIRDAVAKRVAALSS